VKRGIGPRSLDARPGPDWMRRMPTHGVGIATTSGRMLHECYITFDLGRWYFRLHGAL